MKEKTVTTFQANLANPFPAQNSFKWTPHAPGRNGTLIAVVLDESGSMSSVRDSTIAGLNEFVQAQAASEAVSYTHLTLPTNREV